MTQETFQKSVFIHKDKLYRLAKRILVSADEASDAVQNVMLKLWQTREKLEAYSNLESFTMQCIKNECFNRLKHAEVVEGHKENFQHYSGHEETPIDNTREIVIQMIEQLPLKQKTVIHLKDIEDYDTSEIAEILELEENAVRINLMRARQKIKVQLEKLFEYEQGQY